MIIFTIYLFSLRQIQLQKNGVNIKEDNSPSKVTPLKATFQTQNYRSVDKNRSTSAGVFRPNQPRSK